MHNPTVFDLFFLVIFLGFCWFCIYKYCNWADGRRVGLYFLTICF